MSNIIEKDYRYSYNVIPGYTVPVWNPETQMAVTTYTSKDVTTDVTYPLMSGSGISYPMGSLVIITDTEIHIHTVATITSSETHMVTIPGYYTYYTQPDTYSVTIDPNIGWNASGLSTVTQTGDCTASFYVSQSEVGVIVGLNDIVGAANSYYGNIDFALYFRSGRVSVIELGVEKTGTVTYLNGEKFSITRNGSSIFYLKDNKLLYASLITNDSELMMDCSLYTAGSKVVNSTFVSGSQLQFASATLSATSSLYGAANPYADLSATSSLAVTYWSLGTDVMMGAHTLSATSSLSNNQDFREGSMLGTATLSGSPTPVTCLYGNVIPFSFQATSGYANYSGISPAPMRMSADMFSGVITLNLSSMAGTMPGFTASAHSMVGGTTLPSTMYMSFQGLLSETDFAEINSGFGQWGMILGDDLRNIGNHAMVIDGFYSRESLLLLQINTIAESIIASTNLTSSHMAWEELEDYFILLDQILITLFGSVSESLVFTGTFAGIIKQIEEIVNVITTSTAIYSKHTLLNSLVETVNLLDSLQFSLLKTVTETITFTDTIVNLFRFINTVLESIVETDSNSVKTIGLMTIGETLITSTTTSTKATFKNLLNSSLIISIPTASGQDSYLAYLFSPETSSVSNYDNYNFTNCTRFGSKYLFSNSLGLYQYGGALDEATAIQAKIQTAALNFDTSNKKQVPAMYMGVDNSGGVVAKVSVDDKAEVLYRLTKKTDGLSTQKVDFGKGLIGRYFQFEIITDAETFSMESIEFYPVVLKRKL